MQSGGFRPSCVQQGSLPESAIFAPLVCTLCAHVLALWTAVPASSGALTAGSLTHWHSWRHYLHSGNALAMYRLPPLFHPFPPWSVCLSLRIPADRATRRGPLNLPNSFCLPWAVSGRMVLAPHCLENPGFSSLLSHSACSFMRGEEHFCWIPSFSSPYNFKMFRLINSVLINSVADRRPSVAYQTTLIF